MRPPAEWRIAAVLGAGTMGRGIAQVLAAAGFEVRLYDLSRELARRGLEAVASALERRVAKGKLEPAARDALLARIRPLADLDEACAGADAVIEAVPEKLELKRRVLARAAAAAGPDALLASNTSSLSISGIAEALPGPARFLGLHYFNPPPVMPLLEIVRGRETSAETVTAAVEFARRQGKDPIVVKDSPGFASSRLGLVLGLEAIRMLEEGVATAEDIDKAMKLGYRHPMGPLELTDHVGLDVRLAIARHLAAHVDAARFAPPKLLERLVEEGKLGRKSGEGFYLWVDGKPRPKAVEG